MDDGMYCLGGDAICVCELLARMATYLNGTPNSQNVSGTELGLDVVLTYAHVLCSNRAADMLPRVAVHDVGNCHDMNTVFVGKNLVRWMVGSVSGANIKHLLRGQCGVVMVLAGNTVRVVFSALSVHVMNVIGLCSQKQMVRTHACRYVAMVANKHALGNRAVVQFPRYSMGAQRSASTSSGIDNTVAEVASGSRPQPAGISFLDILPETRLKTTASIDALAFSGGMRSGIIEGHSDLHSRCVKSRGVSAPPAQLIGLCFSIIAQNGGK